MVKKALSAVLVPSVVAAFRRPSVFLRRGALLLSTQATTKMPPPFVAKEWAVVDTLFEEKLLEEEPLLDAALRRCAAAGLPEHQVSATQGKFLYLVAK